MKNIHFSGSMPYIVEEISNKALLFNRENPRSFEGSQRCVAYALDGSRLLTFGYNQRKTHTFTRIYHDKLKYSIHAEADMTMKLLKYELLYKVTDIITIRGTQRLLNSYPCSICQGLLNMYFNNVRLWWYSEKEKIWKIHLIR